ncbi:hypothetical protein PO878_03915 [Iamia majanohamensis]|uniref:Uncharacterized protein n=1 Tax=Iamia majanohamensis TaxID=467976 RepID=A0AAF0BWV0_9ACTN|nr:hypothetical protein [Iamia majanohamensis]WCO67869.1 hypothetical protein PO878_03915 [Iamia majanohamensis]
MAELNEFEWELDGLLMGDGTPYPVISAEGLEDLADTATEGMDRSDNGRTSGQSRMRDRAVTITLGPNYWSAAEKNALKAAVSPSVDGVTPKLLRWRPEGEPTKRALVKPRGKPLDLPGDLSEWVYKSPRAFVNLTAPDPVVYSDATTATAFEVAGTSGGADTVAVVNAGSLAATSPGCMTWTITAGASGCVWPYLRHSPNANEQWLLSESLTAGQVVTVTTGRVTYLGLTLKLATVKGPSGSPIPFWPVLRPGSNNIVMGCLDGGFTATLTHRSTW